jgi:ABC-type nitrate/sulfonate/bicarbonate transport system permease component
MGAGQHRVSETSVVTRLGPTVLRLGTMAAFLIIWEGVVRVGLVDPFFLAPPSSIISTLGVLITSGTLSFHLAVSAQTFLVGYGAGILIGITVGLLDGWYQRFHYASDMFFTALYSTPIIVLLPLMIIWFGLGRPSQLAIILLATVFPIVFTVSAGVRALDQQIVRVGLIYGARSFDLFRDVAIPGSIPYILAGLRVSLGRALVALIFAEWFAGSGGVGYLVALYGQTFQTARLLSVVVVIVFVSLLGVEGLRRLETRYLARVGAVGGS